MADKTANYELTKPLPEEFYDVAVQNGNMDIIDAQLKKLQDEKADLVEGKIPTEQLPDMDVGVALAGLDTKAAPADEDGLVLTDSTAKNAPKRVLWSAVKTALGKLFAAANHKHNKADITDFPSSITPAAHTHTKEQITDFPTSMPASDVYPWAKATAKPGYTWAEISGKPSTFAPSAHTHDERYYTEAEVNSLLAAKQNAATAIHAGNIGSQSVSYAIYANAGNALTVASLRNEYFAAADTTPSGNGQICWTYG